jgi:hypothetical protein
MANLVLLRAKDKHRHILNAQQREWFPSNRSHLPLQKWELGLWVSMAYTEARHSAWERSGGLTAIQASRPQCLQWQRQTQAHCAWHTCPYVHLHVHTHTHTLTAYTHARVCINWSDRHQHRSGVGGTMMGLLALTQLCSSPAENQSWVSSAHPGIWGTPASGEFQPHHRTC